MSAPKQTCAPNKFKAGLYRLTNADLSLKSALEDWQDAQLGHIGIPGDDMYGSQLIMTDDILECFVDLAHFNQIANLSLIRAQVNWCYNDTWGMQILKLVKKHVPRTDSVDQPAVAPGPSRLTLQPTDTGNIPGPSTSRQPPGVQSSAITHTPDASNPKPRTRKGYKCNAQLRRVDLIAEHINPLEEGRLYPSNIANIYGIAQVDIEQVLPVTVAAPHRRNIFVNDVFRYLHNQLPVGLCLCKRFEGH
ncbi:hypothetical protein EDB89DRAFT_2080579 [Lactarius sanguifluus]|nr:hypothetical protein EDB89DRAFT_2080579 [Lactarius sanguifluus]